LTTIPPLERYPKTLNLRDGSQVVVRPLKAQDKPLLYHFFARIPESDRHYLKENVTSPEVIQAWTSAIEGSPFGASLKAR
jgi:hypothetical protein